MFERVSQKLSLVNLEKVKNVFDSHQQNVISSNINSGQLVSDALAALQFEI